MLHAERLRILVEVAHAGSIATAARRMGFTPSALSQQLARLEREVGCTLLERRPTGASLTEAGRLLVTHGEVVAGELRAAERAVATLRRQPVADLGIGTFATAGQVLLPPAMRAFREAHPDTRLRLIDLEPPGGYGLVVSGELDLLITHRYPGVTLPPARGLARRPLLADRLRLVLPADHRLAAAPRLEFEDFADDDWVSGDQAAPSRICFESLADETGVHPRVAYETRDYAAILALVRAGLGVSFVPQSLLGAAARDGIVVRDLTGRRPVREILTVHRERPSEQVMTMVELLRR
ncbi:DNA-binding transcriptional LysR family regulator [Amycolatopsis bartoniae]|uniref:LysR family transcriptional regulator n=1 Tax=Amycolatopsis bartoniae TaxID=941986 RepID=A0A8H9IVM4_9PSEU|nr:LysR family transcriptional regulator [Amycolatopsis bartoniae]MBB2933267.1 DNA-binding transcriptional LysR family regulator [Amycolatopsis bartoniae]TVS99344.1 LysR family transcriptional regulator [Amycolatopsis bartoniae]GHF58272.1 LysR family transcriptional regulator [Amycolatopsis bartoniae]